MKDDRGCDDWYDDDNRDTGGDVCEEDDYLEMLILVTI